MKEIWKDINKFEGYYQVSNLGKVKRLERKVDAPYLKGSGYRTYREKLLNPSTGKNGYADVSLSVSITKSIRIYLHRLVAIHFIPNLLNYPMVMHKDNNPLNNSIDNLMWGNNSMNIKQAYKDGLKKCTFTKEDRRKGGLTQGNINKENGHWDIISKFGRK